MAATRRRANAVTEEAIQKRRVEILRHAANVIVTSGVAGCSLAATSESTGFSIGMIQHYFRTRDRLIDACIEQRMVDAEAEWRAVWHRVSAPLERLRALLDFAIQGDDFVYAWRFWLELQAAASRDDALRFRVNNGFVIWHRMFHDAVTDVVAAGLATPVRPVGEFVNMLLGLCDGLATQSINGTYGMTPQHMYQIVYMFAARELGIGADVLALPTRQVVGSDDMASVGGRLQ